MGKRKTDASYTAGVNFLSSRISELSEARLALVAHAVEGIGDRAEFQRFVQMERRAGL
jgi:hypothetical protein